MNQILFTGYKEKSNKNKKFFLVQLLLSSLIVFVLIFIIIYYFISLQKKEKLSKKIIDDYNVSKLYSINTPEHQFSKNNLFGIIEIPKINLYYPIFSYFNEELLKIAPCKFYGDSLKTNGNICIAGHNYNNSLFFSKLSLLNSDDKIFLYDNFGQQYTYTIVDIYEVKETDKSPVFNYDKSSKELTLVTCNNLNSNRLIVKAKQ